MSRSALALIACISLGQAPLQYAETRGAELSDEQWAERRDDHFVALRSLLLEQGVPFEPNLLLEPNWQTELGPILSAMPEMQAQRSFAETDRLGGVYMADSVTLPARIGASKDVVIIARRLILQAPRTEIVAPGHHVYLFLLDAIERLPGEEPVADAAVASGAPLTVEVNTDGGRPASFTGFPGAMQLAIATDFMRCEDVAGRPLGRCSRSWGNASSVPATAKAGAASIADEATQADQKRPRGGNGGAIDLTVPAGTLKNFGLLLSASGGAGADGVDGGEGFDGGAGNDIHLTIHCQPMLITSRPFGGPGGRGGMRMELVRGVPTSREQAKSGVAGAAGYYRVHKALEFIPSCGDPCHPGPGGPAAPLTCGTCPVPATLSPAEKTAPS